MKLAIMQPYFFPYIGYWQLMQAVDTFVIYDDVNFQKRSWMSRNNILINGQAKLITLPLIKSSLNKKINAIEVEKGKALDKLLKTIQMSYSKAPQYHVIEPLIEKTLMNNNTDNLAHYLSNQLQTIAAYLGLNTHFLTSSHLPKNNNLSGQDKILNICEILGATTYINAPGGRELYDADTFTKKDIQLRFIEPKLSAYQQFGNDFIPGLSIIDALMFNNKNQAQELINQYDVVA